MSQYYKRIHELSRAFVFIFWIFSSMSHFVRFQPTHILDLLTMLYHPVKVSSVLFNFLLNSCSNHCTVIQEQYSFSKNVYKKTLFFVLVYLRHFIDKKFNQLMQVNLFFRRPLPFCKFTYPLWSGLFWPKTLIF